MTAQTMTAQTMTPVQLLAQADLLLLIAEALKRPCRCTNDLLPYTETEASDIASASGLDAADSLRALLNDLLEHREQTGADACSDEFYRLFEGSTACPANESTYVRRDKGAIIPDINGFYMAFGFQINPANGEKADHVAAELEYMAMLLVRLATALNEQDNSGADVCAAAFRKFGEDHAGQWIELFAERLFASTRLPLYESIAALLACFWKTLAAFHEIPLQPELQVAPVPAEDAEDPYECGMA